ncbi:rusticyanin [Thermoplasma sp.]|uniref:rusticyanin n=1 Tax=Thermoplasma sp. TaxID=1973142 RepID=UPI001272A18D|nr:rusticyanin [Thermoplasma sp.]KAA8922042.1 MAG: rusticyanin [Thermoplasma sp.]
MNGYKIAGIAGVLFLVGVLIFSAAYYYNGNGAHYGPPYLTQSQLESLNVTDSGVQASPADSTIYINSSTDLLVMAGPMNAPSMYSFEILGMFNPTLVIRDGVTVHFTVVNIDTDSYHNFVISSRGPPYPYMSGMGSMGFGSYGFMTSMNFLPPQSSGHFYYYNLTYTFSQPGTFWYLCTYPGHAENGMYGKITVDQ